MTVIFVYFPDPVCRLRCPLCQVLCHAFSCKSYSTGSLQDRRRRSHSPRLRRLRRPLRRVSRHAFLYNTYLTGSLQDPCRRSHLHCLHCFIQYYSRRLILTVYAALLFVFVYSAESRVTRSRARVSGHFNMVVVARNITIHTTFFRVIHIVALFFCAIVISIMAYTDFGLRRITRHTFSSNGFSMSMEGGQYKYGVCNLVGYR